MAFKPIIDADFTKPKECPDDSFEEDELHSSE